jgi:hypothetical protein
MLPEVLDLIATAFRVHHTMGRTLYGRHISYHVWLFYGGLWPVHDFHTQVPKSHLEWNTSPNNDRT